MPTAVAEDEYIRHALDPALTKEMASVFGSDDVAPAKVAFYDNRLKGTGTFAYYANPKEIAELYRDKNLPLSSLDATVPYIGLNPDLKRMDRKFVYSVIDHEKSHAAQPKGKLALTSIHAYTPFGKIPLGTMLVEGWNEYGLERRGKKSPSRYFDEMYGKTAYSHFRDFVYELENQSPGATRQIIRAARKGGTYSAMRLIDSIPGMDKLVSKYAFRWPE